MLYTTVQIKDKDYQCKLSAKRCVELEKKFGTNFINVLTRMSDGALPKIEDLVLIFHVSLEDLNHGITLDNAYDLFDAYIEDGHNIGDFIQLIMDILVGSGLIPKEVETERKN